MRVRLGILRQTQAEASRTRTVLGDRPWGIGVLLCASVVGCGSASSSNFCGDGLMFDDEQCDDGNNTDGDGCSAMCQLEGGVDCDASTCTPVCGDGIVSGEETCDDGNGNTQDACPDGEGGTCQIATCGDGFVWDTDDGTEECDDANDDNGDSCIDSCHVATCGDGFVWDTDGGNEACDTAGAESSTCLGGCRQVVQVVTGGSHACALFHDGAVKCWGGNAHGQLGLGDRTEEAEEEGDTAEERNRGDDDGEMSDALSFVDLGTGVVAVELSAGGYHTCALLQGGSVKCWGSNAYGTLGLGDRKARGDEPEEMGDNLRTVDLGSERIATAIAAGSSHTCAILDDGSVKCWGSDFNGALGQGGFEHRGDEEGEMGDDLPTIDLGAGRTATSIAAGWLQTCAILDDASLKCWGSNTRGQLGLGDDVPRGNSPGQMGNALPAVDLGQGRTATHISLSGERACAVLDDGSIKCWGRGDLLGLGDVEHRGDEEGEMGDELPAVQLGEGLTAKTVSVGHLHTCVIMNNNLPKCWGFAPALGLGFDLPDVFIVGTDLSEMGDALPFLDLGTGRTVTSVQSGGSFTCALLDDSSLKCWGLNLVGQLGLGDTEFRGNDENEMGDDLPNVIL